MSVFKVFFMITAAIGSVNATASPLADLMRKATGYETKLHSNVTAYDICMFLATGYQYNQMGSDKNITTEAYDDHDQGIAKILTRHVNDEYDNTTVALDSYNKTQRVVNFDVADCAGITEDELISWFYSKTAAGTYSDRDSKLDKRSPRSARCSSNGQNCYTSDRKLDPGMCSVYSDRSGTSCGCAEYGPSAAACQTARLRNKIWFTDHHQNWGDVTALMIWFRVGNRNHKKTVGFIATHQDYS